MRLVSMIFALFLAGEQATPSSSIIFGFFFGAVYSQYWNAIGDLGLLFHCHEHCGHHQISIRSSLSESGVEYLDPYALSGTGSATSQKTVASH